MIKINLIELSKKWAEQHNGERLTGLKLSKETGIRPNTIVDYRNGRFKDIRVKNLIALLQFFKCDIADLIKYEEE